MTNFHILFPKIIPINERLLQLSQPLSVSNTEVYLSHINQ